MKKLLLVMMLSATPVIADDNLAFCVSISEFAETVMHNRQQGVELPTQLGAASGASDSAKKIIIPIILEAYDSPRYRTESNNADEVKRFKETILLRCLRH